MPPHKPSDRVTLEAVPNAAVLRILGRSQLEFVSDLFWIRMGNMAGRAASSDECAALLPIANLIADLTPRFKFPYYVGGVMAPYRVGRSTVYENAKEAEALMARGVIAVPKYERLYLIKSYTELVMLHDPVLAAKTLEDMAALPDAPKHIRPLASRLMTQAGHFDDAREFVRTMLSSEDPQVRADAEARLMQIDLEEVLDQVDEATRQFVQTVGHRPQNLYELVARGLLKEMPVDPLGGTIELTDEGARSSTHSSRLRAFIPLED